MPSCLLYFILNLLKKKKKCNLVPHTWSLIKFVPDLKNIFFAYIIKKYIFIYPSVACRWCATTAEAVHHVSLKYGPAALNTKSKIMNCMHEKYLVKRLVVLLLWYTKVFLILTTPLIKKQTACSNVYRDMKLIGKWSNLLRSLKKFNHIQTKFIYLWTWFVGD